MCYVYLCVYVCKSVPVCQCVYACLCYMYLCVYMSVYVCLCICASLCGYVYVCICVCIYVHMCLCVYVCVCIYVSLYVFLMVLLLCYQVDMLYDTLHHSEHLNSLPQSFLMFPFLDGNLH